MVKNTQAQTNSTGEREVFEPKVLYKRIGTTTYIVSVNFDYADTEKLEEKVFRLIEREARSNNGQRLSALPQPPDPAA
jgi:hypothetical protein